MPTLLAEEARCRVQGAVAGAPGTPKPKPRAHDQRCRGEGIIKQHVLSPCCWGFTDLDVFKAFGTQRCLGDDTIVIKLEEPQQRRRVHHLRVPMVTR